jgi:hypothetical protein
VALVSSAPVIGGNTAILSLLDLPELPPVPRAVSPETQYPWSGSNPYSGRTCAGLRTYR